MKHLRTDYDPIQDPRPKPIPDDEPVFLLRAQDEAFIPMLLAYVAHQHNVGAHDMADFVDLQLPAIRRWQSAHGVKVADLPDDAEPGFPS